MAGLALCGSLGLGVVRADTPPDTQPTPSVLIETGQVRNQSVGEYLTVYGQVVPDPERVIGVSAAHGGQVTQLRVGLGQQVTAGQILLQLATDPTARLAYEQARAQVAYAHKNLAQVKALFAEQLATRAELAKAEQQLTNARNALQAQRRLGANHAEQIIRAPQDAIVTQLNVAAGDRVQAGAALLALGARHRLWIKLGIEPEDVARLHPGMMVALQPVFGTKAPFRATLSQVHAVINPATHLVDAIAPLSGNITHGLIPGMWMRGHITLVRHPALTVPQSAVLHDAHGAYLFAVTAEHRARRIDVTTGLTQDGRIAVQGRGLHAGQTIVTVGNYELDNGMSVRLAPGRP
ncbi:hypothetical protein BI364_13920 [Acidihalobacter yilgarnensis]|uniref:YknX-like C-terminal permuted SH3-like domain-containing protein n=1 Tax=Acidihalobacter yilgarnensis TaxID=2819280 RepID=A0A1D8IR82_9GAMM|nr:efflux RND transporter periplasmic adaptor subunit [Acidihalobacter yilgarnensis]AOU98907.1 hypothetical protein BI364_13920 [Acidihalobacter yilgarnensis]